MPEFDRSTSPLPSTLAYSVFKERFTEVNRCYWASIPLLRVLGRAANTHPRSDRISHAFGLSGQDVPRYDDTLENYDKHVRLHAHWTRLNSAVSLSAALEGLLHSLTRAAVLSDPIGEAGWPKIIDGALLLKRGRQSDPLTGRFVSGTWNQRVAEYKKAFGDVPEGLLVVQNKLENLRRIRNAMAHRLGREENSYKNPLLLLADEPMSRLSAERLKKFFKAVGDAAAALDSHLSVNFIGAYELIELFHHWKQSPRQTAEALGIQMKGSDFQVEKFRTLVGTRFNQSHALDRDYVTGLAKYYGEL